jgi:hypothetical protein
MKPSGIISLLTDFGDRDGYVAAMKAVILGINPRAALIDLSHEIEPQNIQAGAFLLSTQSRFFPPGTIHVAVVDPGVGTNRRLLAVQAAEQFYLAPDNGLLDFCIELGIKQAVEITNESLWRQPVSNTFHGRDILAPVAAHLSLGQPLQEIGTSVEFVRRLPAPKYSLSARAISGQIVYIDRFGNLITNISLHLLREFAGDHELEIDLQRKGIGPLRSTYGSVDAGAPVAVIGGFDRLEIGVNQGNASIFFGAQIGDAVTIRKK